MIVLNYFGTELSAGQRRTLALQQSMRTPFLNSVLQESVDQALAAMEQRKEQGAKPEKLWFLDRQESGTTSVAEWMGY
ncbi:MAG: hypothetical protein A3J24_11360 [Deltaproteobacteria bacterium RIFCSPLOWO2_02_FULL_53_8]|nr:MAG: hypothetical protein A3J24_11360 [Deltaproteobacteria bacterium RIFCSPLOWO2_02_FULL_53_8]